MKTLILKDFKLILPEILVCSTLLFFMFGGTFNISAFHITFTILVLFPSIICNISMNSKEDRNDSIKLFLSMPIDKKTIIISKYLSSILIFFYYFLLFSIIVFSGTNVSDAIFISMNYFCLTTLISLTWCSVYFSIYFISGRIINIISPFLIFIGSMLLIKFSKCFLNFNFYSYFKYLIIVLCLTALSISICIFVLKNKNFKRR
ncbi:ABC-2 transporter permease [Clostridium cochlearium]|uniref:ABC-2 transporter permease n=1 Tax=Clostridium cochlearium TaxID=1494 RepID=UPI00156E2B80|nr:ABC-2 transporter permease [Clostridium cochlearium]MCG4578808.1 ABC-2 transporter permease [Clostridium cochlearium]NSJ90887.1 ABC-2 transporter permease [Coprococcus sp. MSK.21.13]